MADIFISYGTKDEEFAQVLSADKHDLVAQFSQRTADMYSKKRMASTRRVS